MKRKYIYIDEYENEYSLNQVKNILKGFKKAHIVSDKITLNEFLENEFSLYDNEKKEFIYKMKG